MLHDPDLARRPAPDVDDLLAAALPDLGVARVPTPQSGPWLAGSQADAPLFRLTRSGGASCLWHPDRLLVIAADLDAATPLFDRVEGVSGWRFEPARAVDAPDPGGTVVAISDGQTTLELALAGPRQVPEQLLASARSAPLRGDRPVPVRLHLSGPALSVDDAAALSPGDLLILPAVAPVTAEGAGPVPDLILELATGSLARAAWTSGPADTAFSVSVAVQLPPALIAPDALAGVEAGTTDIGLGALREGTQVTLSVAGRPFGTGTIVRLASRFAVEIAAPAAPENPPQ